MKPELAVMAKYDYVDIWGEVDYDRYNFLTSSRIINCRIFTKVNRVINNFLVDNNIKPEDVIVCGSLASNLFMDQQTKVEEPEFFKLHSWVKSYGKTRLFKYSDIDLCIKSRPDLKGHHHTYDVLVDVGGFLTEKSVPLIEWRQLNFC